LHVDNTILSIRKRCVAEHLQKYLRAHLQFAVALLIALSIPLHAHADNNDYILGAGDEIRIQVYQEDDLSMVLKLDESGTFDYPYLGTVTAKNRTLGQLQNTVTNGLLQDVLVNPNVSVSIVRYRDFYIGGEVKKSGAYPYQPGLTVKQAITLAGGVT